MGSSIPFSHERLVKIYFGTQGTQNGSIDPRISKISVQNISFPTWINVTNRCLFFFCFKEFPSICKKGSLLGPRTWDVSTQPWLSQPGPLVRLCYETLREGRFGVALVTNMRRSVSPFPRFQSQIFKLWLWSPNPKHVPNDHLKTWKRTQPKRCVFCDGIRINNNPPPRFFNRMFPCWKSPEQWPLHTTKPTPRFFEQMFSAFWKSPERHNFSQRHPSLYWHDMCERSHLQLRR